MNQFSRRSLRTLVVCLAVFARAGMAADSASITVLSGRPDTVTGGDALLRVVLPPAADPASIAIRLGDANVTPAFRAQQDGHTLIGLVQGLTTGRNVITVVPTGSTTPLAELAVTNHPAAGPVFSGPHEQPFICRTADFALPDGSPLGAPLDADCSVKTVVSYVYRSTKQKGTYLPLPSRTELPADVANTTTTLGKTVPYVVRIETGTANRAIYQIAMLHDPTSETEPSPFAPPTNWNQRLLYSFGGGCVGGWFTQGSKLGGNGGSGPLSMVTDAIVGKGYAHASSSLNVFGNNCNDVTAAETMMMVKETFIEHYGPPLFTFGRGGSGGAYQQIQIADNYPGLLDGIIPSATFPDVLATIQFLTDIQLLDRYFSRLAASFTDEQKRAIAGVGNVRTIASTAGGADRIKAPGSCPAELPTVLRYSAKTNPTGARCNVFDHTANVYGRDPATGFALRPVDNVGVQYGLDALNKGLITPGQFLDLNENIGGYDRDGNYQAARSHADLPAVEAAYRTGRVTYGGAGLAKVPIIDQRGYLDMKTNGDLHLKYHSFGFRARLAAANGNTTNEVLLVTGERGAPGVEAYTISSMDEWLTALIADTSTDPVATKIARAKPAGLVDSCYDAKGNRILEEQTFTGGQCNALYPTFAPPRMMAGGPVTNDVLKCALKPVDLKDYRVAFTEEERARLAAIFPEGVCDWTSPGVGRQKLAGTWLSY